MAASAAALLATANRTKSRLASDTVEKIVIIYHSSSLHILNAGQWFLAVTLRQHADEKRFFAYASAAVADIRRILRREPPSWRREQG